MSAYQLTRALRREDLTLAARDVTVLQTIEPCLHDFVVDPSIVLVDAMDRDEPCVLQAIETFVEMNAWERPIYVYVPLAFGPVPYASSCTGGK
jgi:hypothetical protein